MVARLDNFESTRIRWLAFLLTIILVQLMELALLQRKYDLFTGGFLQPYSYLGAGDRLLFIGFSFWMDLVLFGLLALLWFPSAERLRIHPLLAAYDYLFINTGIMGLWLAVKFKVLSYFNDTINFLIVRNLGGGSLIEALHYVMDESVLFLLMAYGMTLTYWMGRRLLRRHLSHAATTTIRFRFSALAALVSVAAVTVMLAWWINHNPALRYGLTKKTSYNLIARVLDGISDFDNDGYGLFRFPMDFDNRNPHIHPGALDIPGNGVDEDGFGGDFTWSKTGNHDALAGLKPIPGDHILLVVLESARGDLVGRYWDGKEVAPVITKMATLGTHVANAYSHTGYTVTSLKAIFNRTLSQDVDRVRLADFLDRSGYLLSFVSGQDESFGNVAHDTHMEWGGHYFFDARSALEDRVFPSKYSGSLRLSEARVLQQFLKRVNETDWSRPNFFYVNLQAAHFPYSYPGMPNLIIDQPLPRNRIRRENQKALQGTYWNAIAVADQVVGRMLDALREKGVLGHTLVVIVGDHGESLFDDGFLGHGHALNDVQTRIPLIINRPGLPISQAVGQVDLAELIVTLATGRFDPGRWNDSQRSQFQFVGSLDHPQELCHVRADGIRTLFDLRTRKVFFSDLKRWVDFEQAYNDAELGPRTRALLHHWESLRWQNHLTRQQARKRDHTIPPGKTRPES